MALIFDIENQTPPVMQKNRLMEFLSREDLKEQREEERHQETVNLLQQLILRSGGNSHSGGGGLG